MKQTWKPTVAGILSIISGAFSVIGNLAIASFGGILGGIIAEIPSFGLMATGVVVIFILLGILLGIVAIVGGIYALRRRNWGLALAGSICAAFTGWFLGILAIIFVVMSKDEFSK